MIFIVLLVIVFGMVVSTMQFGSMPDGGSVTAATPRAQVYAVNMETWHQAAMLAAQSAAFTPVNCVPANPLPCADALNPVFWNSTTGVAINEQALAQNWPEYVPVVAEGDPTKINSGGWQSFLIKNIDGTCADPANVNCPANGAGTENYVLTVFRGYGYGGNYTNSNISSNTGSMNNAQIATALAKTVQDRMGVGNLQCTPTANGVPGFCSFTRAAAYTPPGGGAKSDLPLQFPLSVFTSGATPLQGSALPAAGTQPLNQVFDPPNNSGLPAIMTRVGGGSVAPPQLPGFCPAYAIAWTNNAAPSSWPDSPYNPSNANPDGGRSDPNYDCYANYAQTPVPTLANSPTPVSSYDSGMTTKGSGLGYTLGAGAMPKASCNSDGTWGAAPTPLPACNPPQQQPYDCAAGSPASWGSTCHENVSSGGYNNDTQQVSADQGAYATVICVKGTGWKLDTQYPSYCPSGKG